LPRSDPGRGGDNIGNAVAVHVGQDERGAPHSAGRQSGLRNGFEPQAARHPRRGEIVEVGEGDRRLLLLPPPGVHRLDCRGSLLLERLLRQALLPDDVIAGVILLEELDRNPYRVLMPAHRRECNHLGRRDDEVSVSSMMLGSVDITTASA
jgi:hypothetical protein